MNLRRRHMIAGSAAVVSALPFRGSIAAAAAAPLKDIHGAGSSVINDAMALWIAAARAELGLSVSYDPIGSADGINEMLTGDADFAASDDPFPEEKLAAGHLIQVPLAVTGITVLVNIPDVQTNQLQLTGPLLGQIYHAEIKNWNDPKIAKVNPNLKLPDLPIHPFSQGTPGSAVSGVSWNFTQFLLATNADWREKYGAQVAKRWAVGSMVADDTMMFNSIQGLAGGIGYASMQAKGASQVPSVKLANKAGKFIEADAAAVRAALDRANFQASPHLVATLVDLPGDAAWPIVLCTYAVTSAAAPRFEAMRSFFKFVVEKAADQGMQASSLPLPPPKSIRPAIVSSFVKQDS